MSSILLLIIALVGAMIVWGQEVVNLISDRYVEKTDPDKVMAGAMHGLADGLDPDSAYLTPDLVKQFDGMSAMMKGMAGLGMRDRLREVQRLQTQLTNPAARLGRPKGDTGKRLTADERRKLKKQREKDARRKKRGGAD